MTDFSKISNLFTAKQRLVQYNSYMQDKKCTTSEGLDVNGDGKVNYKDKSLIQKQIKEAQQQENIFDFTQDDEVGVNDWLLFNEGIDLDGDGEISEEEKAFLKSQKNEIKSTVLQNIKETEYTGMFNGKYYVNGKRGTGECDGKYYKTGYLYTGSVRDDKTTSTYKNGEKQTEITDNNGNQYPRAISNSIIFKKNDNLVTVRLKSGSSAVINEDGTVEVTKKDGKIVTYNKNGKAVSTTTSTDSTETTGSTNATEPTSTAGTTSTTNQTAQTYTTLHTITTGTSYQTVTTGTAYQTVTTGTTSQTNTTFTTSTSTTYMTSTITSVITETTNTTGSTSTTNSTLASKTTDELVDDYYKLKSEQLDLYSQFENILETYTEGMTNKEVQTNKLYTLDDEAVISQYEKASSEWSSKLTSINSKLNDVEKLLKEHNVDASTYDKTQYIQTLKNEKNSIEARIDNLTKQIETLRNTMSQFAKDYEAGTQDEQTTEKFKYTYGNLKNNALELSFLLQDAQTRLKSINSELSTTSTNVTESTSTTATTDSTTTTNSTLASKTTDELVDDYYKLKSEQLDMIAQLDTLNTTYSEGLTNKKIKMAFSNVDSQGNARTNWQAVTFDNLLDNGYMIIGTNGSTINPSPYVLEGEEKTIYNLQTDNTGIDVSTYNKLSADDKALFEATCDESTNTWHYTVKKQISQDEYNKLSDETKAYITSFVPENTTIYSYKVNNDSTDANDVQELLSSGQAQIVTKDFFNYLVQNGGYTYEDGIQSGTFAKWLLEWESGNNNTASIVDWNNDKTGTFANKLYTEDDEAAIAQYEKSISEWDKKYEEIGTNQKLISNELDNLNINNGAIVNNATRTEYINNLKTQKTSKETQLTELNSQLTTLNNTISQLINDYVASNKNETATTQFEKEYAELNNTLSELKASIANTKNRLEYINRELNVS